VSGQAAARASTSLEQLCRYNFLDIAAALGLALVVNVAVLLVAAATFHQAGTRFISQRWYFVVTARFVF
jgi:Mn2+/Fe2+ NRAMP family transporter